MIIPIPVPLTGPISITDMKNAFPSINSNSYRDYEGAAWYKPSTGEMGFINLTDVDDLEFRGKVQPIVLHFSKDELNVDLKSRLPYYYQGVTGVLAYIDAGVKIGSASSGNPAFTVNGFTSHDGVEIINNGSIKGAGGNGGGAGGYTSYSTVDVNAPVVDPGNPGQTIPQPDPPYNPGLYGIYVRGTLINQPTPFTTYGTGGPNNYEQYYPEEYWVFRAGKLTYHSIETMVPEHGLDGYDAFIRAIPPPDTIGNYQGSIQSYNYKNDDSYVSAYNIPGITTQVATSHAGTGGDSGVQGGTALFLNYPTIVVNNGSLIGGGGGGGAGAGGSTYGGCCGCGSVHYSGGAGGGGAGYTPGNNATETVGGAGSSANGTTGGKGGNPGQAGQGSGGGGGGAAGFAIENSSFVNGGVGSVGGSIIGRT